MGGGSGLVNALKLFAYCNFTSIELQYFDASNTTYMEEMFYCSHIKSIPHLDNLSTDTCLLILLSVINDYNYSKI